MTAYEIIFNTIQERVYNGELSFEDGEILNEMAYDRYAEDNSEYEESANDLVTYEEYLDNMVDDIYVNEKKAREEYALHKFKKQHKYDPKTKTIDTGDGHRQPVDFDLKSTMTLCGDDPTDKEKTISQTAAELLNKDGKIHLDKNFFKLKNSKRREALLQHEIGHTRMHTAIGKNSDPRFELSDRSTSYPNENKDKIQFLKDNNLEPEKVKNAKDIDNQRKKIEKYAGGPHATTNEFEADRYAANRTNESDLKKGVRETYKFTKKKKYIKGVARSANKLYRDRFYGLNVIDPTDMKNLIKNQNKIGTDDYNRRIKVLKDKEMKNNKYYK